MVGTSVGKPIPALLASVPDRSSLQFALHVDTIFFGRARDVDINEMAFRSFS